MKIPFKQKTGFGCGLYSLSNLFNDPKYIEYIKEEASFTHELNKVLEEDELWLTTIFCVQDYCLVQNRLIDVSLFDVVGVGIMPEHLKENYFRPYLIVLNIMGNFHLIAVAHCLKTDNFFIIDSLDEEIREVSKGDFVLKNNIIEVLIFENKEIKESCKIGKNANALLFNYKHFQHLRPHK